MHVCREHISDFRHPALKLCVLPGWLDSAQTLSSPIHTFHCAPCALGDSDLHLATERVTCVCVCACACVCLCLTILLCGFSPLHSPCGSEKSRSPTSLPLRARLPQTVSWLQGLLVGAWKARADRLWACWLTHRSQGDGPGQHSDSYLAVDQGPGILLCWSSGGSVMRVLESLSVLCAL